MHVKACQIQTPTVSYKINDMDNNIISVSKGPQLGGGKFFGLFFLLVLFIIIAVVLFVNGSIVPGLFLLLINALLSVFILDIQGVDINKEEYLVREYKFFLWKFGVWKSFKGFDAICLDFETYIVRQRTIFTNLTTAGNHYYGDERHGHFLITLVDTNSQMKILLAEKSNYEDAKALSIKLSERIGLPFNNIIKQRVEVSKQKRRKF
jgi:hypothetical protein